MPMDSGSQEGSAMLSGMNIYCSTCRQTRHFLDRETYFECDCCKKKLIKVNQPDPRRGPFSR